MQNHPITLTIDILMMFIFITSYTAVLALALGHFDPSLVLLTGLTLSLFLWFPLHPKIKHARTSLHLGANDVFFILSILSLALFFRSGPYLYIMGDQDQGVYVNMASEYARNGKPFLKDSVRKIITDKDILELYDSYNHKHSHDPRKAHLKNKYEGAHLPGIYIKNLSKSEYVFQFYPLHPLWMAIIGKIVGLKNCIHALTLFSLLSVVAFYLLALEMSDGDSKTAAFIAILLAVNPLHSFFSKWPVTEVVALTFTAFGFYYFLRFYNSWKHNCQNSLLFLLTMSAASFGCFFFTRISGFMYLPFFYAIMIVTLLLSSNTRLRLHIVAYVSVLFVLYIFSVAYGLHFSFPYSYDIYNISFRKVFGSHRPQLLAILAVSLTILPIVAYLISGKPKIRLLADNFIRKIRSLLPFVFLAILVIAFYKAYLLGFTDRYINDPWLGSRWALAASGWAGFTSTSVIVAIKYLSPITFLAFIVATFKLNKDWLGTAGLVFILGFWFYIAALQWTIPYQYYYARYLLSEIVPYTLLLTVVWTKTAQGRLAKTAKFIGSAVIVMYFAVFSSFQLQGKEADGAYTSLNQISGELTDSDLLLLDRRGFRRYAEIKTPLVYFFGHHVFDVASDEDVLKVASWATSHFPNVYLLSQKPCFIENITLLKCIPYRQAGFEHTRRIPRKFMKDKIVETLWLYKVDTLALASKVIARTGIIDISSPLVEIEGFYGDRLWTNGRGIIRGLDLPFEGSRTLEIVTRGYNPDIRNLHLLAVKTLVNGEEVPLLGSQGVRLYFFLPQHLSPIRSIEIISNTFIPKERNINNDTRKLGLDIVRLQIH
ncbi:hypothetical protein SAMN02745206_00204 [Desulfacinum infernum DSM 9756]|uniref:Dolichyl-phosphate-mannose-protein mannosyltransferase n=1 Tax=Desulfacinum infernum DSM 9756 TaxID=1121391 RepID=A0A1M4SWS8_9BACT|nr:hypothetical protein [Desulfacinum infernum]SHE36640.1 hypothetical protein SAMN02745206_00204 [Desulfacinum infernum DSM 9756]